MTPPTAVSLLGRAAWLTLLPGVRLELGWLTQHTPALLSAWQTAPSAAARRAVARAILRLAADQAHRPPTTTPPCRLDDDWVAVLSAWDPRLTDGPDWPPLVIALTRARAAGYDLPVRLPALLGAAPQPGRHPARELHWRLLADCPATLLATSSAAAAGQASVPPSTDSAALPSPAPGAPEAGPTSAQAPIDDEAGTR